MICALDVSISSYYLFPLNKVIGIKQSGQIEEERRVTMIKKGIWLL